VHTVHGWSFHDHMGPAVRATWIGLERVAAWWCDRLAVVTERDLEKGLAARIGRPEQYALIRSGFDVAPFLAAAGNRTGARRRLGLPDGPPLVGTVMRLSAQK